MSALRQSLKRPHTWLAVFVALVALAACDARRAPAVQVSARLYVMAVRLYQTIARPLLAGRVRCRFRPSCSEYSRAVVARHGVGAGLVLTARRVSACQPGVVPGTLDLPS